MTQKKIKHYPAIVDHNTGFVLVAPQEISRAAAIAILLLNSDKAGVFSLDDQHAEGLCKTLGGTTQPLSEVHNNGEDYYSGGYWPHYHPKKRSSAHSWFIGISIA